MLYGLCTCLLDPGGVSHYHRGSGLGIDGSVVKDQKIITPSQPGNGRLHGFSPIFI